MQGINLTRPVNIAGTASTNGGMKTDTAGTQIAIGTNTIMTMIGITTTRPSENRKEA